MTTMGERRFWLSSKTTLLMTSKIEYLNLTGIAKDTIDFEHSDGTPLHLNSTTTLLENAVDHDGHIHMTFLINVKGFDGKLCKPEKRIEDTVDSISQEASACLGVPRGILNLTHNEYNLDNPLSTIGDESIVYNDTLHVPMWIHVHDYNGGVNTIVVTPEDSLDEIKDRISGLTGIPKITINIEHGNGTALDSDDATTLVFNNVNHDGNIYMPFSVNVQGFDGVAVHI